MKLKSSFSEKDEQELFNFFSASLKSGEFSNLNTSDIRRISDAYLMENKKIGYYKRIEIGLTDIEFEAQEEKSEKKKFEYFLAFQEFIKNIREEKEEVNSNIDEHIPEVVAEPLPLEAFKYHAHNRLLQHI
jgi:hypothetical protein